MQRENPTAESRLALPPAPLLEARGLTRTMNGTPVLARIDLTLFAGQIVALGGINGAGKTTLLHCLAGRLRPTSGELLWLGVSPARRTSSHLQIGLVAHESLVYLELTARENLLFAARMYGVAAPARRVTELLEQAHLESQADQPAGRLSKGVRQRLSLARALVHAPPIVILDEPFTALDSSGRQWLEDWLRQLRAQGQAICFSSHDESLSHRLADQVLELRCGCLHFVSPVPVPVATIAPGTWEWRRAA